jgi:hypothetical protein
MLAIFAVALKLLVKDIFDLYDRKVCLEKKMSLEFMRKMGFRGAGCCYVSGILRSELEASTSNEA